MMTRTFLQPILDTALSPMVAYRERKTPEAFCLGKDQATAMPECGHSWRTSPLLFLF
jgi:hypothetical protein